ncbi:MAG: magnesium citrate secondary transporter, partial [Bacteroidetes bacterium]
MKRTLTNPIFLLCVALAATNQVLEKAFGIFAPIVHCYLDDLLCFPIVLTLGLAMYRYFSPN